MCETVDATRGRGVDAHVLEEVERLVVGHALQLQAAETRPVPLPRHEPIGHRRLPAAQDHSHIRRQGRKEYFSQPDVEEPEDLIRVERQHDPFAESAETNRHGARRAGLAASGPRQAMKKTSLRRLDAPTVQSDDRHTAGSCRRCKRAEQGALADAGNAVDVHEPRPVVSDQSEHLRQLRGPYPGTCVLCGCSRFLKHDPHHPGPLYWDAAGMLQRSHALIARQAVTTSCRTERIKSALGRHRRPVPIRS
jgi:hypothetical protein